MNLKRPKIGDLIMCHNEPALVTDSSSVYSGYVEVMMSNGYKKLINGMNTEIISEGG